VNRQSTVKVDASSVQGEGAFVLWKRLTWGERKAIQRDAQAGELDTLSMLITHIAGWNWVDGDGNALPLPTCEADLEVLYDEEITFLADVATKALSGRLELTPEAEKN